VVVSDPLVSALVSELVSPALPQPQKARAASRAAINSVGSGPILANLAQPRVRQLLVKVELSSTWPSNRKDARASGKTAWLNPWGAGQAALA
jgi:hypothetical protein